MNGMNALSSNSESQEPSPSPDSGEGKLLLREAREYMAEPAEQKGEASSQNGREPRAESKRRFKGCTGERLFREEPRRYRLIASLLAERTVSDRAICRTCLCDRDTLRSIERREAESSPSVKRKLTQGWGRLSKVTLGRLEEEASNMNHSALAITAGIATDKFLTLSGSPNLIIAHDVNQSGESIFERMARLHDELTKTVRAKIIETTPALPNS
jgi:hypothetical protein